MAHPEQRPATYQDSIDLPEHLVGEIIGGELYTQPRPAPRHARASSVVGGKLTGRSTRGMAGRVDGGSWTSRNCTWGRISWCRIWQAGGGSGCRGCRIRRGLSWLRTGRVGAVAGYCPQGPGEENADLRRERRGTLWLLDPDQPILEVYENAGGHWLLLGVFENDDEVAAVPFDASRSISAGCGRIEITGANQCQRGRSAPGIDHRATHPREARPA
jgi:hypothetical protein